jgi:hypothetical protein
LLHETIWHQGTVYEASAYAVPFLLQMLAAPDTPDKAAIAFLLASLANGHSYLQVHALADPQSEAIWHDILAKRGHTLIEELRQELAWTHATKNAVCDGIAALAPYLVHEDASLRWEMIQALASCTEQSQTILPLLHQALAIENEPDTREALHSIIGRLTAEHGT